MDADEFANAPRGRRARFRCGLHGTDIASNQHGDVAVQQIFLADELNICGLDHGIRGFHSPNEAARLNHP